MLIYSNAGAIILKDFNIYFRKSEMIELLKKVLKRRLPNKVILLHKIDFYTNFSKEGEFYIRNDRILNNRICLVNEIIEVVDYNKYIEGGDIMKKEVRLIFNLDELKERTIYDKLMEKTTATAYIKDLLDEYFKGEIVKKSEYDNIIKHITNTLNIVEDMPHPSSIVEITINADEVIEEVNEFDD